MKWLEYNDIWQMIFPVVSLAQIIKTLGGTHGKQAVHS